MSEVLMGFPLGLQTQTELAKRIHEAHQAGEDAVIACWCPETAFFLAVYLPKGTPHWFECCGPCTEKQAKRVADEISERNMVARIYV